MKRVFAAILVTTACVVASTPGFARGGGGMVAALPTYLAVAASCAILRRSWDRRHRRCPLSKTGFRPHSRLLHSHPPSTGRRRGARTAVSCRRLAWPAAHSAARWLEPIHDARLVPAPAVQGGAARRYDVGQKRCVVPNELWSSCSKSSASRLLV